MHDIKIIREHPDIFDEGLRRRGLPPFSDKILALDDHRRAALSKLQAVLERRNAISKEIGQAMAVKDTARADALKVEVNQLKSESAMLEAKGRQAVADADSKLSEIPNTPLPDVPVGRDENDNVELRRYGAPQMFQGIKPKEHFEIGEALGLMDFETAARLSGARFVVLKGALARMERALGAFMLDLHTREHGYTEVSPPLLVRDEAMLGTAQLPKFAEDQFSVGKGPPALRAFYELVRSRFENACEDKAYKESGAVPIGTIEENLSLLKFDAAKESLWLIPTAEVPLTNLVRETILDEGQLPLRLTAYTPCFRAEAGAAGRDTRGMIRLHQFNKVELVSITTPEKSPEELERMTACAEEVLKRLGLQYRIVVLCTGDMGFASQKTYDIEVWLPGQERFREISSCSTCGDFQARRMAARYRSASSKNPRFVHTLNGSGVAVGRALVAIVENYQNADGSVTVPEALRAYMGGTERIG